ncbi:MAG: hypothetical protein Q4A60_03375 [Pasteurellaceae bacterium]|nr:hypothetical protein [Pasteurellaceae bacterium]
MGQTEVNINLNDPIALQNRAQEILSLQQKTRLAEQQRKDRERIVKYYGDNPYVKRALAQSR